MTGRFVLVTLIAAGCAAAAPAVHGTIAGGPHSLHGASPHAAIGDADHGPQKMRAHVEAALDTVGLSASKRTKALEIIEAHIDEAADLHEKLRSGELTHEQALAEHERIVAEVKAELAPVLTQDEIRRLEEALHPKGSKK